MSNGCPKCEAILKKAECLSFYGSNLCLDCQLAQAEADVLRDMNRVEEIKQKILKEKQNDVPTN